MNLGTQIVAELARRQMTGRFFDYAGYQRLRQISTPSDLQQFLADSHYQGPPSFDNAGDAVDYLVAVDDNMGRTEQEMIGAGSLVGLFFPLFDGFLMFAGIGLWLCRRWRKQL